MIPSAAGKSGNTLRNSQTSRPKSSEPKQKSVQAPSSHRALNMPKRSIGGGLRPSATLKNLKEPAKLKDLETNDLEVCIEDDDELTEKPNKPAGGDEESK